MSYSVIDGLAVISVGDIFATYTLAASHHGAYTMMATNHDHGGHSNENVEN